MIQFQTDDCPMPTLIDPQKLERWIRQTALSHGKRVGEINYIFCSDAKILEANNAYLGHDYFTDIITFDYSEDKTISGDIYIGVETVASNAQMLGLGEQSELLRVIIHGILHLCGFKDKTPKDEEIMHEQEDISLKDLQQIIN
jgi:probable rRNA maturation factor